MPFFSGPYIRCRWSYRNGTNGNRFVSPSYPRNTYPTSPGTNARPTTERQKSVKITIFTHRRGRYAKNGEKFEKFYFLSNVHWTWYISVIRCAEQENHPPGSLGWTAGEIIAILYRSKMLSRERYILGYFWCRHRVPSAQISLYTKFHPDILTYGRIMVLT